MKGIKKAIIDYITSAKYQPMDSRSLFHKLQLPKYKLKEFHKALSYLEKKNKLQHIEGTISAKKPQNQVTGVIHLANKGFGFVEIETKKMDDVFIPKHQTQGAMDGDKVEIVYFPGKEGKGPEGKVLAVLERKRNEFVAVITKIDHHRAFGISPSIGQQQMIEIEWKDIQVKVADRVLLQIIRFATSKTPFHCKAIKNLGSIYDASKDTLCILKDCRLRTEFPSEAIKEAKKFGKTVSQKALSKRIDLTKKITLTIDPTTAKDFDDAISIEKDKNGHFELGVHIADVAHYVKVGSALDQEALKRCNSTYFPGEVIPMIPFELSNELCSLKPNEIRLTMSVMIIFDQSGKVMSHKIFRSFIKSAKRFTYEEALDVLEKRQTSPYAKQLHLMLELTNQLKAQRKQRGSVEFGLPEAVIQVDDLGNPKGITIAQYDITHQMIEEFMLKANEMVATHLTKKQLHMIYRVHESPAAEDYKEFIAMAYALGIKLPSIPTSQEISQALYSIEDPMIAKTLAIQYIRLMKLAIYSENNIGHFGLSLEHYCHFTSPIRRYSDLVIQRLIVGEKPAPINLAIVAKQISEQERTSAKAEHSVLKLKKLRLLYQLFQKDPKRQYEGIITHIKPNGLAFELTELLIEGFLPLKELDGQYIFLKKEMGLFNKKLNKKISLFDLLTVSLKSVDLLLQVANFELVAISK